MGLTLTATQIAGKHLMANPESWILLVEFSITGIKSLPYYGSSGTWYLGDFVTGATSKARGRLIEHGATPMKLWDVSGTFQTAEALTGLIGGVATASGSQADDNRTLRYALAKEDVTWGGYTWTATSVQLDQVGKSLDGSVEELGLLIYNDVVLSKYVEDCSGLEGQTAYLRIVYSGNLAEAAVFCETCTIVGCGYPEPGWVQFSLGSDKPLSQAFPNMRYEIATCRNQFKNTASCQYAGAVPLCNRRIATCKVLGNSNHFGGFPGIPGGLL